MQSPDNLGSKQSTKQVPNSPYKVTYIKSDYSANVTIKHFWFVFSQTTMVVLSDFKDI